jgi:hypothetical protein
MNDHKPLIERIEALVDLDNQPDWEDVVRRAEEAPAESESSVRTPRQWHSHLARRLVPVFVLAAAAFAFVLIAPWGHGRSFTARAVAERALVAIGDGPVLHVILHREGSPWTYVDLVSGQKRPMVDTSEIWYDSERHFEYQKNSIEGERAYTFEVLQTPAGTWASYDIDPGKPHAPSIDPALGEFVDGYRSALENGTAHVAGTGTVDGHNVTWIELSAKSGCTERVAVDQTSSLPTRIENRCRTDIGIFEIDSIETLPAGSGDFSKPEKIPSLSWKMGRDQVASTTPFDAVQALPGALWVGESISSLQLSSVYRARLMTQNLSNGSAPFYETGIQLHYGDASPAVLWPETSTTNKEASGGDVVLQEEKSDPNAWFWPYPGAPAGSMLTNCSSTSTSSNCDGFLVNNGIYVYIHATSQELLLEVARALEPIQAPASPTGN